MQRILLAVFTAGVAFAGSAQSQQSQRPVAPSSRWVLNGHSSAALGTSVGDAFGSIDTHSGLGAGIEAGYLITPRFLAYAGVDIVKQGINEVGLDGDFGLTHIEAGARLSFPISGSKLLPYVGGWVGRRSLTTTVDDFVTGTSSDLSLSGLAAGASGGVQFFVSPRLALDGGVSLGVGKMGNVKVDGQKEDWGTPDNTTTTRLRFGANWYP
ncbi:MAG TPA: outer membrane beta-barrel protein [Gemmatimonadales bacterium]|nr:outer membrane beta-barrel protein [Gemmatimonadales bacterium]